MENNDQALENYIKKLMDIQYATSSQTQFTEEELKNIALESGLTERAWQQSQKQAQDHLTRGKAHLAAGNYLDAAGELETAATLMPGNAEANCLAGKAFLNLEKSENQAHNLQRATYFLDRTLMIDPSYNEAYQLKTTLNNTTRLNSQAMAQKNKTKGLTKWLVIGGAILVIVIAYFSTYNSMVELEEETTQAWAQVDNVYQRRADLIPNLVETVKGAANFERETLNEVVKARSAATSVQIDPTSIDPAVLDEYAQKQNALSSSLSRLMVVAEDYPDLRSTENFRDLQTQLEGTENRIAVERKRFNEAVQRYNAKARKFPYNLLGFAPKAYFSTSPDNRETPAVTF